MEESLLISTSDIAELVDERLAVVSTWRNRFKDGPKAFPSPAGGTPARPLFEFTAVSDWVSRNRPEKDLQGSLLRIRVWSAIRSISGEIDQFDLVYWLHQELKSRKAQLSGASSQNTPTVIEADEYVQELFGTDVPIEIDLIRSLVATASANDLIEVSDFSLTRLSAGYGRSGGDIGAVGSNASVILAAASSVSMLSLQADPVIYDPACGIGETLIETFKKAERFGHRGTVIGTEINVRVAALASIRLELRDIPARIRAADSLLAWKFEGKHPDLIVAEPPLGIQRAGVWGPEDPRSRFGVPPTRNADLAWVADAASRLKGSAQAFILTGMDALSRGGVEEGVRANLVRSGAVKAVFALPPNLLQYSSKALALWVLIAPSEDDANRSVALLDSSSPDLGDRASSKLVDWLLERVPYWVTDPDGVDPLDGVQTALVHFGELLEEGMDLTPARWTARPDYSDLLFKLEEEGYFFSSDLREFQWVTPDFSDFPAARHVVTVREMTEFPDSREAKLWTGRRSSNDELADVTVNPRDISNGVLRAGRPGARAESGFWTEPGDIIFTTMSTVRALVDTEGGHRIGSGVYALRLDRTSRFDPRFVALCLAARWNERHQKGSTVKHTKPRDLEIPLLPLDAQLRWIDAFQSLEKVKSDALEIADRVDELEITAQNALRFGNPEMK